MPSPEAITGDGLGTIVRIDPDKRRIVGLKQIEQGVSEITGLEWILLDTECEATLHLQALAQLARHKTFGAIVFESKLQTWAAAHENFNFQLKFYPTLTYLS